MTRPPKESKLRRKDLRAPDEFESLVGRASGWVQDHLSLILGGVGVLVLALVVFVLVGRARSARSEEAAVAFRSAQSTLQAGKLDEAIDAFTSVAREHAGTPSGDLAALYKGHALTRKPDPAAAAAAYGEYLAASAAPPYLRQEALVGLGHARLALGDASGATDAFDRAAAIDGPYRTDAVLGAARLSESAGKHDRALDLYSQLLKDTIDPDLRTLVQSKLPPVEAQTPSAATAGP